MHYSAAAPVCDHDLKIIATRDLRRRIGYESAIWDIRVCIKCGELNSKGGTANSKLWKTINNTYRIAQLDRNLIQRTNMLISSITKGDAQ